MKKIEPCPICELENAEAIHNASDYSSSISCERCGYFTLPEGAVESAFSEESKALKNRALISHEIRKMQRGRTVYLPISGNMIKNILTKALPNVAEQADKLILWYGQNTPSQEQDLIPPEECVSVIGAQNKKALFYVMDALQGKGLLAHHSGKPAVRDRGFHLTFDGWMKFEELKRKVSHSRVAFMAMDFKNKTLDKIYKEHFKPAVQATGFNLQSLKENTPAGLIDNRLRVEIRNARFLIADLTNKNAGAYWEAGLAEGLGKPVIYLCEETVFKNNPTHFDTNHHHTVLWDADNPRQAVEGLKVTIRATLPEEAEMADD